MSAGAWTEIPEPPAPAPGGVPAELAVGAGGDRWARRLEWIHRRHDPQRLLTGPSGHAVCPTETADGVRLFGVPCRGGVRWLARRQAAVADVTPPTIRSGGLTVMRVTDRLTPVAVWSSPATARTDGTRDANLTWVSALCSGHIDLVEDVMTLAIEYLSARTSEGAPLLSRQLPQACIADTAMDLAVARECLAAAANVEQIRDIHRRMVSTGREVIRLLGARGFLHDGPGGALYAAELTCRVYLDSGDR